MQVNWLYSVCATRQWQYKNTVDLGISCILKLKRETLPLTERYSIHESKKFSHNTQQFCNTQSWQHWHFCNNIQCCENLIQFLHLKYQQWKHIHSFVQSCCLYHKQHEYSQIVTMWKFLNIARFHGTSLEFFLHQQLSSLQQLCQKHKFLTIKWYAYSTLTFYYTVSLNIFTCQLVGYTESEQFI